MSSWFYAEGEEKIGPVSEEEMIARIVATALLPTTMVWRETMEEWVPAEQVEEFVPYFNRREAEDDIPATEAKEASTETMELFPSTEIPAQKNTRSWLVPAVVGLTVVAAILFGVVEFVPAARDIVGLNRTESPSNPLPTAPDLATLQLIDALQKDNPGIKVEQAAGKLNTFRLTRIKTGETLTVGMADIQNAISTSRSGALVGLFKKPSAESSDTLDSAPVPTAPSTSQNFDSSFPSWIPAPSDAKITFHSGGTTDGVLTGAFEITAQQPPDQSADFYQDRLEATDFVFQRQISTDKGNRIVTLNARSEEAPTKSLQLKFQTINGATQISGSYSSY